MRELFPVIFSTIAILVVGGIQVLLLYALNRPWWNRTWMRRSSWSLPLAGIIFVILWGTGAWFSIPWLSDSASLAAVVVFVLEAAMMIALPISGILHLTNTLADFVTHKIKTEVPDKFNTNRRAFLKTTALVLPATTIGLSVAGVTRALGDVNVSEQPLTFASLPPQLEGIKLLHLSDIHLGHYVHLGSLERVLSDAEQYRPDLVLASGDIADDLDLLPDALKMFDQLRPRLGVYATLGNHEYFRGIKKVIRIYDASPVPLLVNETVVANIDGIPLAIAGLDDPRSMSDIGEDFYVNSLEKTLEGIPPGGFTILMSHRPYVFEPAARRGVDLTLAGHTHGGQIGLAGRSVFERFFGGSYLWGHYRIGDNRLFTSAGVGHWFPFRLGCPPEAPVFRLESSSRFGAGSASGSDSALAFIGK